MRNLLLLILLTTTLALVGCGLFGDDPDPDQALRVSNFTRSLIEWPIGREWIYQNENESHDTIECESVVQYLNDDSDLSISYFSLIVTTKVFSKNLILTYGTTSSENRDLVQQKLRFDESPTGIGVDLFTVQREHDLIQQIDPKQSTTPGEIIPSPYQITKDSLAFEFNGQSYQNAWRLTAAESLNGFFQSFHLVEHLGIVEYTTDSAFGGQTYHLVEVR